MTTPETLRNFAAECQAMAKIAKSAESKTTWAQLAARWNQCAELAERHLLAANTNRETKRSRRSGHATAA
jgi:hypothetical protein